MLLTTFMVIAGWKRSWRLGCSILLIASVIQTGLLIWQVYYLREALKAPPPDAAIIIASLQSPVFVELLAFNALTGLVFYFIGVCARIVWDRRRSARQGQASRQI